MPPQRVFIPACHGSQTVQLVGVNIAYVATAPARVGCAERAVVYLQRTRAPGNVHTSVQDTDVAASILRTSMPPDVVLSRSNVH
jgi:hypothetical protein